MANRIVDKLKKWTNFSEKVDLSKLPQPLPANSKQRLVRVFVEGYEDVAFWRGIFDHFSNPYLYFEISVPTRKDLPKGKKILLNTISNSSEELLLCADSDFDFLFGDLTPQARLLNSAKYMFHTYAYATENYLCYAPSLHNVCVKATKNDTQIFDFVKFMQEYSRIIYPIFIWYSFSAQLEQTKTFSLIDFRNTVRVRYLDISNNGTKTLEWLKRNVARKESELYEQNSELSAQKDIFEKKLIDRGLTPESTYLFMQGHTLMDNVILIIVKEVCERLRDLSIARIKNSHKKGIALKNEMSNYTNTQRSIKDVLLDNENYTSSPLYKRLSQDIELYINETLAAMRERGEIPAKADISPATQDS